MHLEQFAVTMSSDTSMPLPYVGGRHETSSKLACCGETKVWTSRIIFTVGVVAAAAVLGYATNRLLMDSELTLAREQFEAIANRALDRAVEITLRRRLGTTTLASIAANAFPDAQMWPSVNLKGFKEISRTVIEISSGRSMGLLPIVTPKNIAAFEDYAYDVVFAGTYPNDAGISSFGRGVYALNPSLNNTDKRYHDTDGVTSWNSPNNITTPFLAHSLGPSILMGNLHAFELFGRLIDAVIACSNERARAVSDDPSGQASMPQECSVLSDVLVLTGETEDVKSGPGAIIIEPVYPTNDNTVLTGVISSTIVWEEVLERIFPSKMNGVDCVLETEAQIHTYHVHDGVATLKGEGDMHQPNYSHMNQTIVLNSPGQFGNHSASYSLTLYPNDELFEVYSTNNPAAATLGAIFIIVFTSLLFLVYEFSVRQEFHHKKAIIGAKRQFVRFISHEVRTPLNAISMGLQLLQDEIARLAGLQPGEDSQTFTSVSTSASTPMEGSLQDKLRGWLDLNEDILSNTTSAVDVLDDLLNYDKIENGTLLLEITVIPIWALIDRTTSEFQLQAKKKKINYVLDFSALADPVDDDCKSVRASNLSRDVKEHKLMGDIILIAQVLRNLISNALKFTPEGGYLTVRTYWQKIDSEANDADEFTLYNGDEVTLPRSGVLQVDVTDTGAGMTAEQVAKVFGEGVQFNVNELQAGQGSGLGLYIAKGISEQHGGSLKVASAGLLGYGTTFTLSLPLHRVPDAVLPESLKNNKLLSSESVLEFENNDKELSKCSLRILIVDDARVNRKLLMRLLQNKGHNCDEAEDGLVAVQLVKNALKAGNPYDTILMDFEMPVMNGPTAATFIRALDCNSFIVGITGNLFPEDVSLFKARGANKVLPKPLNMCDLEDLWVKYGVVTMHDRPKPHHP